MCEERNFGVRRRCRGVNEHFSNSSKRTVTLDVGDKWVSTAISKVIPLLRFHHLNSAQLQVAQEVYMVIYVRKTLTEQSALSRAINALLLCSLP